MGSGMRIPGSNLLNTALRVIDSEPVWLHRYQSRTSNSIGVDSSVYFPRIKIAASVQAVPREKYSAMGLDFKKIYVQIFTTAPWSMAYRA